MATANGARAVTVALAVHFGIHYRVELVILEAMLSLILYLGPDSIFGRFLLDCLDLMFEMHVRFIRPRLIQLHKFYVALAKALRVLISKIPFVKELGKLQLRLKQLEDVKTNLHKLIDRAAFNDAHGVTDGGHPGVIELHM